MEFPKAVIPYTIRDFAHSHRGRVQKFILTISLRVALSCKKTVRWVYGGVAHSALLKPNVSTNVESILPGFLTEVLSSEEVQSPDVL